MGSHVPGDVPAKQGEMKTFFLGKTALDEVLSDFSEKGYAVNRDDDAQTITIKNEDNTDALRSMSNGAVWITRIDKQHLA